MTIPMPPRNPRRSAMARTAVARGAVIFVGVFFAALVAEEGLEVLGRHVDKLRLREMKPFYGWSFYTRSGVREGELFGIGGDGEIKLVLDPRSVYGNAPNQHTANFSTDGDGARLAPASGYRANGRTAILLGGSTAFGTGLNSDRQTMAAQLEAGIPGLRVVNAAVIGHESGQELAALATVWRDRKPDLVMTLDGVNDSSHFLNGRNGPPEIYPLGFNGFSQIDVALGDAALMENDVMMERLLELPQYVFPELFGRMSAAIANLPPSPMFGLPPLVASAASNYVSNIEVMNVLVMGAGAQLLCVLQPQQDMLGWPFTGIPIFVREMQNYRTFRRIVKEALQEGGIQWLDLNDFPELHNNAYYLDPVHLNARGNALMAKIIGEQIRRRGLLKSKAHWPRALGLVSSR